jgi:hemolysin activation/secretion protein
MAQKISTPLTTNSRCFLNEVAKEISSSHSQKQQIHSVKRLVSIVIFFSCAVSSWILGQKCAAAEYKHEKAFQVESKTIPVPENNSTEQSARNSQITQNDIAQSENNSSPQNDVKKDAGATNQDQVTEVKFDINEIRVRGNTLLDKLHIELVMYPFLGKQKTVQDVEAARKALEQRYKDAGFPTVLVDIPEQDVEDGIVVLKVTEAKINRLSVTGSDFFSLNRIRNEVPSLKEDGVLHLPSFQEQLSLLNMRTGDRSIVPVLKPGRIPGTVDVELKVRDVNPLHGSLEFNNRGTATTTKNRASVEVSYDNMWQREHTFSMQFQTAPRKTEEVQVIMGTYLARLKSGNMLAAYYVDSDSDVAATSTVTVIGNGTIAGARMILPLPMITNQIQSTMLGIDYKKFIDTSQTAGLDTNSTPIEYYNAVAQYNLTVKRHRDQKTTGITKFDISATFGIGPLNEKTIDCQASIPMDQFECKRNEAKADFAYLRAGLSHEARLAGGFSLYVSTDAQGANSPLISNEQYSAGGMKTVRGYYESQRLSDDGAKLTVELRSPSFGQLISKYIDDLYYLVFADRAVLRTHSTIVNEEEKWYLGSIGLGLQMTALKSLSAELYWAHATEDSDNYEGEVEPEVKDGDDRIHFQITYGF